MRDIDILDSVTTVIPIDYNHGRTNALTAGRKNYGNNSW